MTNLDSYLEALRQRLSAGEFAYVEQQLPRLPELLRELPEESRASATHQLVAELQQWRKLVKIHHSHLRQEWMELPRRNPYRGDGSGMSHRRRFDIDA